MAVDGLKWAVIEGGKQWDNVYEVGGHIGYFIFI